MAGYLAARFSVIDDLTWIVGNRLTSWETNGQGDYGVAKTNSAHGVLTPYTGLVYDLTDEISTYASYTTIFTPQRPWISIASNSIRSMASATKPG